MAKVSIKQTTQKVYLLTERLYLNADKSRVVPDGDPAAAFLFGGVGQEVSEGDVEQYGLLVSAPDVEEDAPAVIQGHLPEDFPGYAWLVEAGITTYAKLRKAGDLTEVSGIGKATAQKIVEALEQ